MKPLTPLQISLLRRYKATAPRDFPLTKSDKLLAAQMRKELASVAPTAIGIWWKNV